MTRVRRAAKLRLLLGVVCLAATGCVHSGHPAVGIPHAAAAPSAKAASGNVPALPEANTFTDLPQAPRDIAPKETTNGVVLHVLRELPLYDAAGGKMFAQLPATQLGSPTWVPVVGRSGDWVQVLLPSRPNHSAGWVRADSSAIEWARSRYRVEVDVDARRMVVWDSGRRLGTWTVGVGKPSAPTPRGRTYIMASIKETRTHFSPVILPLGTHSETFDSYGGGPGTVALHGWPDSSAFGHASSDGCVRVPSDALRLLTSLPLGTLVLLR